MARFLIILGIWLVLAGLLWPWIAKTGIGRLPGDFVVEGKHFRFYFPLATGLLVSVAISALLWLFRR